MMITEIFRLSNSEATPPAAFSSASTSNNNERIFRISFIPLSSKLAGISNPRLFRINVIFFPSDCLLDLTVKCRRIRSGSVLNSIHPGFGSVNGNSKDSQSLLN